MTNARPVTVADMLDARDRRAERQKRFLETSPVLICLTMNIPGFDGNSRGVPGGCAARAERGRSASHFI